jgi:hypothetical protein
MANRDKKMERARQILEEKKQEARARAEEAQLTARERPPDDFDPRAKSSAHRKKTADKWNQ